jgi:hypothetical protein
MSNKAKHLISLGLFFGFTSIIVGITIYAIITAPLYM